MSKYKKLSHVIYKCDYHIVWVPKYRLHILKGKIKELMGVLKGKLAIKLFRSYPKLKEKPYWDNHFWARSYFVSTLGLGWRYD